MKQCKCQWILQNQIASAIFDYNYNVKSIKKETNNLSSLDRMAETVDAQENMQIDIKEAIDRYFRKTSTCSDWKCTEK